MPNVTLKRIFLGFLAAAISVLVFHQTVVFALHSAKLLQTQPWSLAPVPPWGVPAIVNGMFWGGLWGVLFAWIWPRGPGKFALIKGANFGLIGPLITGRWLLVPWLKGEPLFAGGQAYTMAAQIVVAIAFGMGIAWIYGKLIRFESASLE